MYTIVQFRYAPCFKDFICVTVCKEVNIVMTLNTVTSPYLKHQNENKNQSFCHSVKFELKCQNHDRKPN